MSPARSPTPEDAACPFLIRIFVTRKHTPLRDFDDNRLPTQDEFHVYGWCVFSSYYVSHRSS
jgi:hypothetical protein